MRLKTFRIKTFRIKMLSEILVVVVGIWTLNDLTTCVCLFRVYTCVYISNISVCTGIHDRIHMLISLNKLKHFFGDPTLF